MTCSVISQARFFRVRVDCIWACSYGQVLGIPDMFVEIQWESIVRRDKMM